MLPGSGIFDMRWAPHTTSPMLALALADGNVQLVQQQSHGWHPVAMTDVSQGMVVTVDWSRHAAREGRAAVSTSTGHLAVMQVTKQRYAVTCTSEENERDCNGGAQHRPCTTPCRWLRTP